MFNFSGGVGRVLAEFTYRVRQLTDSCCRTIAILGHSVNILNIHTASSRQSTPDILDDFDNVVSRQTARNFQGIGIIYIPPLCRCEHHKKNKRWICDTCS